MSTPFIAEIKMFGGNFAPRGFAFCQGQLISIAQNTALFALLGTTYGGDGRTTFALPDLRGRVPMGTGQGPGTSNYQLGQQSGAENVTLTTSNLPSHSHGLVGSSAAANTGNPSGNVLAVSRMAIYSAAGSGANLANGAISPTGSGTSFSNLQPSLAISFIIALEGIFPSRN